MNSCDVTFRSGITNQNFQTNNNYDWRGHSSILSLSALIRHIVQPFTDSDDTKCCDNIICPPEDGHVNAPNMSRIVM